MKLTGCVQSARGPVHGLNQCFGRDYQAAFPTSSYLLYMNRDRVSLTNHRAPERKRPVWRRLFGATVLIAAAISVSAGAKADFNNGNTLYAECAPESGRRPYCAGYVAAIADVMRRIPLRGNLMVCGSPEVTLRQMVDVVNRSLAAHPEDRHSSAESLVALALAEAFPCRR